MIHPENLRKAHSVLGHLLASDRFTNLQVISVSEAIVASCDEGILRLHKSKGPFVPTLMDKRITCPKLIAHGEHYYQDSVYMWELWEKVENSQHGDINDVIFAIGALNNSIVSGRSFEPFYRCADSVHHLDVDIDDWRAFNNEMLDRWRGLKEDRSSMVHGDLYGNNLLNDGERLWMIDLGDMGVGPKVWDSSALVMVGKRFKNSKHNAPNLLGRLAEASGCSEEDILEHEPLVAWVSAMRAATLAYNSERLVDNASARIKSLMYPSEDCPQWVSVGEFPEPLISEEEI